MSQRARALVLLVAALALVGTTVTLAVTSGGGGSDDTTDTASATEPDLSGVPEVVATVDGVDITRAQFEQAYTAQFQVALSQASTSGQPVDQPALREQTAASLVDSQLLIAEAESRDYDISDDDLADALQQLAEENGLQDTDELITALEGQGLDRAAIDEQLEQQVRIDRLVAEEGGDLTPSEDDLREVYEQVVAEQGGEEADVPSFDEVRDQLEQQGRQENENAAARELVEQLREGAEIEILL